MKKKTKNPGRIAAKDLPPIKTWVLPRVQSAHVVRSPFKEKGSPGVAASPVEELVDPEPLTVEALERIRKEARQEGFQQGQKEGFEQGEQQGRAKGEKLGYDTGLKRGEGEIDRLSQQLSGLIQSLQDPFQKQQHELESALLQLVVDTSKAVIKHELRADPGLLAQVVEEALAALPHGEPELCFTVHPDDLSQMERIREREHADWSVRGDEQLTQGGVLVKGANSYLDYSVENRFTQVVSQLLDQKESDSTEEAG
ncbi:MAG: flagellar assembly protein FliH [Motiliproteus sp.]|nr:flagellar assembly protein FliH [Motiliproteus sp.]MCW9052012.1 flagellar assembly protein FliH [Motiliproteus sp.]